MGYLAWRTMTGRNQEIGYQMQLPGHAKCVIDGGFGKIKTLYRRSDVETVDELGNNSTLLFKVMSSIVMF